jgi:hypothetical protein
MANLPLTEELFIYENDTNGNKKQREQWPDAPEISTWRIYRSRELKELFY